MKTKTEYNYVLNTAKKIKAINFLGGECYKCGRKEHWVLTFHHTGKKEKTINELIRRGRWSNIEKELSKASEKQPVILTAADIRFFVRRFIEDDFPQLAVLSYLELLPTVKVTPLGRIGMEGT